MAPPQARDDDELEAFAPPDSPSSSVNDDGKPPADADSDDSEDDDSTYASYQEDEIDDDESLPDWCEDDEELSEQFDSADNPGDDSGGPPDPIADPRQGEGDKELTPAEIAMLDLLTLCDSSGARRGLYDDLLTVLRRHSKKGFTMRQAKGRESFLGQLRKKVSIPEPVKTKVRGRDVVHFQFLDMLTNLLNSSMFHSVENLCVNPSEEERFSRFVPPSVDDDTEVALKKWAQETYDKLVASGFDPDEELFFPLILYADKTGTDVNQRYPLEPWMFSTLLFRRHVREQASAWRHLGFVPSLGDAPDDQAEEEQEEELEEDEEEPLGTSKSQVNLQLYHDFLNAILQSLKDVQHDKPYVTVNLGGIKRRVRLHVHVAIIMGDQKSQDCVCGRKSTNAGNAGRVHRACMCSSLRASDGSVDNICRLVNAAVIEQLNKVALVPLDTDVSGPAKTIHESIPGTGEGKRRKKALLDHLGRKVKLARALLARPYTMHPLRNAFDGVLFGANKHGVFVATADDHLHSTEAGLLLAAAQVAHDPLTEMERNDFEESVRRLLAGNKSSVSTDYPRGRLNKGLLQPYSHEPQREGWESV